LTSAQPFTTGSPPTAAQLTTPLNSLSDNIAQYGSGDTIVLNGVDANGNAVTNVAVPVDPVAATGQPATMQDLINAINANFQGTTASLDASGNLVVAANKPGPNNLSLSISDGAGDVGSSNWANHAMAVTATGANGTTVNTTIQVFDPQGTAHTLNLVFQKLANNTWNLTGSMAPSDGTLTNNQISNITFNQNGSFSQAGAVGSGSPTMTVQFNGSATPQQLSFNFGASGVFNGLTQAGGASSAAATGQNGYAAGSLSTVSINQAGVLNGVFTNGQTLPIAQLAIANFANPAALSRTGNNYYALSSESGPALIGAGSAGGNGSVQQGQLESSNVDVSLEFTRLIIAQQGYQVNAHVITAADQILQDLGNILH
jgi:flagellar hook protein FlgE